MAAVWLSGCNLVQRHMRPVRELEVSRQLTREASFALERGDLQEADRLLVEALRECKTDAEARALYGDVLWRLGQHEAALQQLQWAVQQAPDLPSIQLRLAEKYLESGDTGLAQRHTEAAIRHGHDNGAAWLTHGRVLQAQGKMEAAIRAYQRSLDCYPDNPDALASLAVCYQASGQLDRALAEWQAALEKCQPGQEPVAWLVGLGQVYRQVRRPADAAEQFAHAAERDSGNPDLLVQAGLAWLEAGDRRAAVSSFQQALAKAPQNPIASRYLQELTQNQVMLTAGEDSPFPPPQ